MPSDQSPVRRVRPFYWMSLVLLLAVTVWTAASDTLLASAGGDGEIDYLPSRVYSAEILKVGSLPMWDPHIYSGMSHIAIVQTAVFYPLNVVMYLLLPPAIAWNLSIVLHFLLLLGFTHAYLRLFVDRDDAAWLGAICFSFCGFIMLHYESTAVFNATAWIPPFFFCLEKWIQTLNWKYSALGGLCLAMQLLAGWPQMVLLSAIYAGLYMLFAMAEQRRRLRLLAGVAVMGLLSAGLGAGVILPTMEFKKYSNLADLTYSHFASLSVTPQSFVLLLFPYLMGADSLTFHRVPYLGAAQMNISAAYMGILPLMLTVGALSLWRRSRAVRFAAVGVVIASILAFGGYTPLGHILFYVPVYNFFRDHRMNVIFLSFFVALLAATFAGSLDRLSERTRRRLAVAVPIGFVALAAIVLIKIRAILASIDPAIAPLDGLWVVRLHQIMRFSNPDMIIAVVTLLASGLLFWMWMRSPGSRGLARLAIVIVFLDLAWFGLTDQPHFSSSQPSPAEHASNQAVLRIANGTPFRAVAMTLDFPFIKPNLNEMQGIDHLFGYSALIPGHYTDLLQVNEFGSNPWRETLANTAILSLLNTRFVFVTTGQWQSLQSVFSANVLHDQQETPRENTPSQNLLTSPYWKPLNPGQTLDPARPFTCPEPPCGMKYTGLMLQKNSIYELRFEVQSSMRHNPSLDVWFMNPNHWRPREMYTVSNVLISQHPSSWLFTYVTGEEDEPVDLRFATESSSPLQVSNISLMRAGARPIAPSPYREIAANDGIVVLENTNVLPRAFFAAKVTRVQDYYEARRRLWDPERPFDPRQETLMEGAPLQSAALSTGTIDRLEYQPNRAMLDVHCAGNCYLVLSDLDLPDWRATIDGQATTLYRTNAVVRGVFVPAGSHHIEFRYRPISVVLGLASMIFTSLLMAGIVWGFARK